MTFIARVYVTLKTTVNDPPGRTVLGGLQSMGFQSVESVRLGKYLEIRITENDRQKVQQQVSDMCSRLLANPVIEEFRFDLEKL